LVNLARVKSAETLTDGRWVVRTESGAELVVSRTYRDELLARLRV
jgi:DNA-binding LytR/AlgR family response regulator